MCAWNGANAGYVRNRERQQPNTTRFRAPYRGVQRADSFSPLFCFFLGDVTQSPLQKEIKPESLRGNEALCRRPCLTTSHGTTEPRLSLSLFLSSEANPPLPSLSNLPGLQLRRTSLGVMSRKGGGRGAAAAYDLDDDYDYDDDYDDDAQQYVVSKPGSAKSGGRAGLAPRGGPVRGGPAVQRGRGAVFQDPSQTVVAPGDDDLIRSKLPSLREVAGPGTADSILIQALRDSNYDLDAAAMIIFTRTPSPEAKALPTQSPVPQPVAARPAKVLGALPSAAVKALPSGSPTSSTGPSPQISKPSSPTRASPAPAALVAAYTPAVADADGRLAMSVVFAGHVDHGKSTILGHLLVQLGHVSARDVQKLELQARQAGKASFHYAWLLDQSDEERRRGVTIDSAHHAFDTPKRRVTVLDAPGHRDFIPSMVSSATQADAAILVVSAIASELAAGLDNSTKEHVSILKTLGVSKVIIVVNKMDAVGYQQDTFIEAAASVVGLLRQFEFPDDAIACIVPVSGLAGVNLTQLELAPPSPSEFTAWYKKGAPLPRVGRAQDIPLPALQYGVSLLDAIDSCPVVDRLVQFPTRLVVSEVAKQVISGRLEAGVINVGDVLTTVPGNAKVTVRSIEIMKAGGGAGGAAGGSASGNRRVTGASAGDTVEIGTSSDVSVVTGGCVLCPVKQPCASTTLFEAHVHFFGELTHAVLPGTAFSMQAHSVHVQVIVDRMLSKLTADGRWINVARSLGPGSQGVIVLRTADNQPIALDEAERCRALGRFILRQNGLTVGGGLVKRAVVPQESTGGPGSATPPPSGGGAAAPPGAKP